MLARLDRLDGVKGSFANASGTLIWLSLRPGVNPEKVAAQARRALGEQARDRTAVPLGARAVTGALVPVTGRV